MVFAINEVGLIIEPWFAITHDVFFINQRGLLILGTIIYSQEVSSIFFFEKNLLLYINKWGSSLTFSYIRKINSISPPVKNQ